MGQPDRARAWIEEALALARKFPEPHGLAHGLVFAALLHQFRRSYVDVLSHQQSAFNAQILQAMCQVLDACDALGQIGDGRITSAKLVRQLRRVAKQTETRLKRLERRVEGLERLLAPADTEEGSK